MSSIESKLKSVLSRSALGMLLILPVGCAVEAESYPEEVEVSMDPLLSPSLIFATTDANGATQCTVGGIRMHCCPQYASGNIHYYVTGVNLATNSFKCARAWSSQGGINQQAPTLNPAGTDFRQDGIRFQAACTSGAMVGLRYDMKRVACAPFYNGDFSLVDFTHVATPQNGFVSCLNTSSGLTVMRGISTDFNARGLKCFQ